MESETLFAPRLRGLSSRAWCDRTSRAAFDAPRTEQAGGETSRCVMAQSWGADRRLRQKKVGCSTGCAVPRRDVVRAMARDPLPCGSGVERQMCDQSLLGFGKASAESSA